MLKKSIVDLESASSGSNVLPVHKIRNGDIVAVEPYKANEKHASSGSSRQSKFRAVVLHVSDIIIKVVIDEELPDDVQERCRM